MNENFFPPNLESQPMAQSGNGNNYNLEGNQGPAQQINYQPPSQEFQRQWSRSVARSVKIKAAATKVINTRAQFKKYLNQNGMDLYTSAVEFQQTKDFIFSSYVIYLNYNGFQEPLSSFLQRYPQLQQPVMQIRDRLRNVADDMEVISPKSRTGIDLSF